MIEALIGAERALPAISSGAMAHAIAKLEARRAYRR